MKTNKIQKYMSAVLMIGASMLWSSCTDTWNEHYDPNQSQSLVGEGTLLSHIDQNPSLANFSRVLKEIGATEILSSPQQSTVWAPTALTAAQADSIIEVYNEDVRKGIKWKENRAITQFFYNHTALYSRPVSAYTDDTLKMMSKKYMQLKGLSAENGTINTIPFYGMELCNNGILYKTDQVLAVLPNVREYIEREKEKFSKVSEFIAMYDEYILDEQSSVPGEIVDGKQVYLDSVSYLSNDFLRSHGHIDREDSLYTMIVPTNEVWNNLYNKYIQYYNFAPSVENADTLKKMYTRANIIEGCFFNRSKSSAYNFHPEDSITNTRYNNHQVHYPRRNVYYDPYSSEGIFGQLEKFTCSNGEVYIDNKGVIDPRSTFFGRNEYEASSQRYYKIPVNDKNEPTMNPAVMYYQKPVYKAKLDEDGNPMFDEEGNPMMDIDDAATSKGYRYNYLEVTSKESSDDTEIEFSFPDLLSGCYYNVYMVTVPQDLPAYYLIKYSTINEKGVHKGSGENFGNPDPFQMGQAPDPSTGLSQDEIDVMFTSNGGPRANLECAYRASTLDVDTILVTSGLQIPYSGYGTSDPSLTSEPSLKFTVKSWGPSQQAIREVFYTRKFALNKFIFVPFETKEEAEAAKHDLDAINDAILQANRKK